MLWHLLVQFLSRLVRKRKWVHYGLTSTDVVDTANSYLLKQANEILRKDLENFIAIIGEKQKNINIP